MRSTQELEQEIRACPDPAVHGMAADLKGLEPSNLTDANYEIKLFRPISGHF